MSRSRHLDLGYVSSTIRFVLLLINFLFLIIGIVLLITACILKWGTAFTSLIKIDGIQELVNSSSISAVAVVLLILSVFIIIVSLFGFIGVKWMNRAFMLIYEIIVLLLFITHGVSLLVVVFGWSSLETEFKKEFTKTIADLNSNETAPVDFDNKCQLSFALSELFKCCGAEGPDDFFNATLVTQCCKSEAYKDGCNNKVIKEIEAITSNLLVVPSVILLVIELFSIIMVPFLMGAVKRRSGYESY